MFPLKFEQVPGQFGQCEGTISQWDDGRWSAFIRFDPAGGADSGISSGTDVVLVLDASFSMFAGAYRNGKVLGLVDNMIQFMSPYDDDGIDVYLHSLKSEPFQHLGAFSDPGAVTDGLGQFMEVKTAMTLMGQRTVCAPVLRDIARRLKEEKGSDRVFVEIVTDGVFDDQAEVEAVILELGSKYNSEDNPDGIRFHFTGIGAQGADGLKFLAQLDSELATRSPGFIPCVQHHSAASVDANVATIIDQLRTTVKLNLTMACLSFSDTQDREALMITTGGDADWLEGSTFSWEGSAPVTVSAHVVFAEFPYTIVVDWAFQEEGAVTATQTRFFATTG